MELKSNRRLSIAALGLAALTLTGVACSSSKSSVTAAGATSTATVASKLVLGGAPECPTRPYCIPGLKTTYGITFKDFKPLDSDGPLTYQAIQGGQIDVALVFSSDAQIAADNLVALVDDKHLQSADYVIPVLRNDKATPAVTKVVNKVSAALTTADLVVLNQQVSINHQDPQAAADAWLKSKSLDSKSTDAAGVTLTIAGFNFPESSILAYVYGDALKSAGANVTVKANLGTRETLEPGLQSGQIDFLPEYAATALAFLNPSANTAGLDIPAVQTQLTDAFKAKNITVLNASKALDTNAFAVTKATAQKYNLKNMSDLAKNG
jgi:osmoprotectant transport system substrate-binding protein